MLDTTPITEKTQTLAINQYSGSLTATVGSMASVDNVNRVTGGPTAIVPATNTGTERALASTFSETRFAYGISV